MRSRGIMTTTSSKTERKRTHDSRVWLVSSAVPYGRTPAVFVICKMQKLKEKKIDLQFVSSFIYFYRYRRRRGGVKVGGGIVVVVGKMMRSVNREISCLVTPSPILLSSPLSGAVRGGGAGGEVCCCVPT